MLIYLLHHVSLVQLNSHAHVFESFSKYKILFCRVKFLIKRKYTLFVGLYNILTSHSVILHGHERKINCNIYQGAQNKDTSIVYITSGSVPSTSTKLSTLIYAHNAPYRYDYNKLQGYHFVDVDGTNKTIRGVWLTTIF